MASSSPASREFIVDRFLGLLSLAGGGLCEDEGAIGDSCRWETACWFDEDDTCRLCDFAGGGWPDEVDG